MGVEKVAISASAMANPTLVSDMAKLIGSQSVVVVIDAKKSGPKGYEVWTHNGLRPTGRSPIEFAREMEQRGAGEVVINSIDNDGIMKGYDITLVSQIREAIRLPLTALGGAGSHKDIKELINKFGIVGASAGSLFVFKGIYRAVLISYPNRMEKDALVSSVQNDLSLKNH
jgi:cyclase